MKSSHLLIALSIASLSAAPSFAGETGTHGGNTVSCRGKPTVLLDYYQAALPTTDGLQPTLIDVDGAKPGEVLDAISNRLKTAAPYFFPQYQAALNMLGPVSDWTATNLKDSHDAGEAFHLPKGCSKGQVAIRQENHMFADPVQLAKLSAGQQDLLRVHEALFYLASQKGFATSAVVRTLIGELLDSHPIGDKGLQDAIRSMKYVSTLNEAMAGRSYRDGDWRGADCHEVLDIEALNGDSDSLRATYHTSCSKYWLRNTNGYLVPSIEIHATCKQAENPIALPDGSQFIEHTLICHDIDYEIRIDLDLNRDGEHLGIYRSKDGRWVSTLDLDKDHRVP
jgi:hypothetical protein